MRSNIILVISSNILPNLDTFSHSAVPPHANGDSKKCLLHDDLLPFSLAPFGFLASRQNEAGGQNTYEITAGLHLFQNNQNNKYIIYSLLIYSWEQKELRDGESNPGLPRDRRGY